MSFGKIISKVEHISIKARIIFICVLNSIILLLLILRLFSMTLYDLEVEITDIDLDVDIVHLTDLMDSGQNDAEWHMKDGSLYRGSFFIGGVEHINTDSQFYNMLWEKTKTSFLVMIKCPESGPVGNCTPGNYLNIAGDEYYHPILNHQIPSGIAESLNRTGQYANEFEEINSHNAKGYIKCRVIKDKADNVLGAVMAAQDLKYLNHVRNSISWEVFLFIFLIITISGCIISMLTSRWAGWFYKIKAHLDNVQDGMMVQLPAWKSHPYVPSELNDVKKSIICIENSMHEKLRMDSELAFARTIQINMMPGLFPAFPQYSEFDIYASVKPAKEIGGDLYDFFLVDKTHIAFVIADVSGKGAPAALFMVCTKILTKNYLVEGVSVADTFEKVNARLCELNKTGHFVTAWLGVLDVTTGKVEYVNAGHNPPLVLSDNGQFDWIKNRSGFVLAGKSNSKYKSFEIQLNPGNRLFLYTDGVTEAHLPAKPLYGEERLRQYLNAHSSDAMPDIVKGISDDINAYVQFGEQFDDITMLMIEYKGAKKIDKLSKKYEAVMDNLMPLKDFLREELNKSECPAGLVMKLLIAAEEIYVNIVNYSYPDTTGEVIFNLNVEKARVDMEFVDFGIEFNPLETSSPVIHGDAKKRSLGGLGIFMTKKIMDGIRYEYSDGKNILSMTKWF